MKKDATVGRRQCDQIRQKLTLWLNFWCLANFIKYLVKFVTYLFTIITKYGTGQQVTLEGGLQCNFFLKLNVERVQCLGACPVKMLSFQMLLS